MNCKESKDYCLAGNKNFCSFCPGFCCYRLPGASLLITAEDINRIARYFSISDGEVRKKYLENKKTFKIKENGSCIFLSNKNMCKRCSIHEARPNQCREFPYNKPCPYLENEAFLEMIQPKIEASLGINPRSQK